MLVSSSYPRPTAGRLAHSTAIITLIAICFLLVLAGLFTRELVRVEIEQQSSLIENALASRLEAEVKQLDSILTLKSVVNKITVERDAPWFQNRLGSTLTQLTRLEYAYALDPDGNVILNYQPPATKEAIDQQSLSRAIQKPFDEIKNSSSAAFMKKVYSEINRRDFINQYDNDLSIHYRRMWHVALINKRVYLITLSQVDPITRNTDRSAKPHYFIGFFRVENSFLQNFAAHFGLKDFKWTTLKPSAFQPSVPAYDSQGQMLGYLVWDLESKALRFVMRIGPIAALAVLAISILALFSARQNRRFESDLRASEAQAMRQAETDPLTGLPNRRAFNNKLGRSFEHPKAQSQQLALFALNLDRFNLVNDTHGHSNGDAALRQIGQNIMRTMHAEIFVARMGADDFYALAPVRTSVDAQRIAEQLQACVYEPVHLPSGQTVQFSASVGLALYPEDLIKFPDLVRAATTALAQAKQQGGNLVVRYDQALDAQARRQRVLEAALAQALSEGTLKVLYQPILDATDHHLTGVEALVRWTHPELGFISPAEFIPLAERTGVIHDLGRFVLETACRDALAWPGVTVSVNVSPDQLKRGNLTRVVMDILENSGLPSNQLEIELTESALIGDEPAAQAQLRALNALGISIALDDFGTGYSSLSYLRRFHFDKVKIDRSFVKDVRDSEEAAVIVRSVVSMCRSLGLAVTAEGIETLDQQLFVESSGVTHLQGYLFGRPGTHDVITTLVADEAAQMALVVPMAKRA
jgi:diguanylate cyclase (GGDEF)-like protein